MKQCALVPSYEADEDDEDSDDVAEETDSPEDCGFSLAPLDTTAVVPAGVKLEPVYVKLDPPDAVTAASTAAVFSTSRRLRSPALRPGREL